MAGRILQLDIDELLSVLTAINPIDLLIEELISKAAGEPHDLGGRLTPWRGGTSAARGAASAEPNDRTQSELILLEDLRVGGRCLLATSALRACRTAALATLAATLLVAPGVVTAAVLGSGVATQFPLALIARSLPGLSHVAVCPSGGETCVPMRPLVIDELDLAGIGWSVTTAVIEVVFGATLIVAASARPRELEQLAVGQLASGAVLINGVGEDLPDGLVDAVDQIYVDDTELMKSNMHRYFVRMHMAGPDICLGKTGGRRYRRIEADLSQVLTGAHAGRTHADDILLVELLGAKALDARLACALYRAALERHIGVLIDE